MIVSHFKCPLNYDSFAMTTILKYLSTFIGLSLSLLVYADEDQLLTDGRVLRSQCIASDKIDASVPAIEFYFGASTCIDAKQYEAAAELYIRGKLYGSFDTRRVPNKSAHNMLDVLDKSLFERFNEEQLKEFKSLETSKTLDICNYPNKIVAPNYPPFYMVGFVLGKPGGKSQELFKKDIDITKTWDDVVQSFCNDDKQF